MPVVCDVVPLPTLPRIAGQNTYWHDLHIHRSVPRLARRSTPAFGVPTVSLHVHERIDPRTVIEAVRKRGRPSQPLPSHQRRWLKLLFGQRHHRLGAGLHGG